MNIIKSKVDGIAKSHKSDGPVKSFRCKARESLGMRRTYQYAAVTKDEAQRRRWTFYETVKGRGKIESLLINGNITKPQHSMTAAQQHQLFLNLNLTRWVNCSTAKSQHYFI